MRRKAWFRNLGGRSAGSLCEFVMMVIAIVLAEAESRMRLSELPWRLRTHVN